MNIRMRLWCLESTTSPDYKPQSLNILNNTIDKKN